MPDSIIDGTGSGYTVAVTDDNRMKVSSVSEEVIQTKSAYEGTVAMKFKSQLEEIIRELKKINIQLSFMTDEELNNGRLK